MVKRGQDSRASRPRTETVRTARRRSSSRLGAADVSKCKPISEISELLNNRIERNDGKHDAILAKRVSMRGARHMDGTVENMGEVLMDVEEDDLMLGKRVNVD